MYSNLGDKKGILEKNIKFKHFFFCVIPEMPVRLAHKQTVNTRPTYVKNKSVINLHMV